ncbi:MAG: LLM class flavin-dependent oxidoreductase, partial [Candidatus Dormibacteraeota bacterium]|nr:LLM class flavin-dependent oxidoreductase [Candidatus Dormibacteraeota bacterium]
MKVGVTVAANDVSGRRRSMRQMVDQAVRAEELGYDSVWVMDHIFIDRGTHVTDPGPDPMVLLGQIAARTSRVELGTLVLCAPFRPPVQLAREAKALQEASGGRLILGVGAGWHQPEFEAFGFPYDHRVGRFEDYLEVLTRLLRDGQSSYQGTYQ